jgi:hypothetical protein
MELSSAEYKQMIQDSCTSMGQSDINECYQTACQQPKSQTCKMFKKLEHVVNKAGDGSFNTDGPSDYTGDRAGAFALFSHDRPGLRDLDNPMSIDRTADPIFRHGTNINATRVNRNFTCAQSGSHLVCKCKSDDPEECAALENVNAPTAFKTMGYQAYKPGTFAENWQ